MCRQMKKVQDCPRAAEGLVGQKDKEVLGTAQSEESHNRSVYPQALIGI